MKKIKFLAESLKNLKSVGTITRSSKYACKRMVKQVDFQSNQVILELGAGDGVITKHILRSMTSDSMLYSFEINDKFLETLKLIKDPRLKIIQTSAEQAVQILERDGIDQVDAIISAIPFVMLDAELVDSILLKSKALLKPGGKFVQIHYSKILIKKYKEIFDEVKISFETLNIPPAFIFTCIKAK